MPTNSSCEETGKDLKTATRPTPVLGRWNG